jgi:hypothetical protein
MLCRVFLMRRRGSRLKWREVVNGQAYEGELRTHYLSLESARYFVASLRHPDDALCRPLVPELWEPVLVSVGPGTLVLRGYERVGTAGDAPAVVQEWRCEILRGRS